MKVQVDVPYNSASAWCRQERPELYLLATQHYLRLRYGERCGYRQDRTGAGADVRLSRRRHQGRERILQETNAIYFKADWASKFDPKSTKTETFAAATGSTKLPMMHQNVLIQYVGNDTYSAVKIPYGITSSVQKVNRGR